MRFTQSIILVRILARASQSAFYTDESIRTDPESSPLVRSGPRFIVYQIATCRKGTGREVHVRR